MSKDKQYKGRITNAKKVELTPPNDKHLGYYFTCIFLDHPMFGGREGYTSMIVKYDEATGEAETLNSRYTVVPLEEVFGDLHA